MIRLFIAIPFSTETIEQLQNICFGVRYARWLPSDQMHLTLRFIGECELSLFHEIADALEHINLSSFLLTIEGVGYFPPRKTPRILWAGIKTSEELLSLRKEIDRQILPLGITAEERKFHPHITLARLGDAASMETIAPFIVHNNLLKIQNLPIRQFNLYSSELKQYGALHQIEQTYRLL